MSGAEVTVVIPTRDRPRSVEKAVLSARAQQGVRVRVLVVDDGSDPPARVSSGVETIRHSSPRGVAAARNAGAALADTEWLAFLDDDDVWAPDKLATLLAGASRLGAELAYSSIYLVHAARPMTIQRQPPPGELHRLLRSGNAIPGGGSNAIVATAPFRAVGGFDETFSFAADWELWLRLVDRVSAAAEPRPLMARSLHDANWAATRVVDVHTDLERLAARHGVSLRRHGPDQQIAYALWLSGRRRPAASRYLRAAVRRRDPVSLGRAALAWMPPSRVAQLRRSAPLVPPTWVHAGG